MKYIFKVEEYNVSQVVVEKIKIILLLSELKWIGLHQLAFFIVQIVILRLS